MARNIGKSTKHFLLLGTCVPTAKQNAAKIRVKRLELDENLLMYFRKDEFYYCHDPQKLCKTNDIVLIQALPQKLTKLITHEVKEVVHTFGDVTDPVTGEKVAKERNKNNTPIYFSTPCSDLFLPYFAYSCTYPFKWSSMSIT